MKGYRTYASIALSVAYWIAVKNGWMPRVPELEAVLVGAVGVFLRLAVADLKDSENASKKGETPQ